MFTIQAILAAHSQVKSGADFPAYIQAIIRLGVTGYETYVTDGHTEFYGKDGYKLTGPERYEKLAIAAVSNPGQFRVDLKAHQQGKTNYAVFCAECARSGIEKWVVSMEKMTCAYFDKAGNEILVEEIPG